ncbi:type II toxin-antitoxin system HicB family antitoxin [Thermococcus sp. MAR1]|uniref:type II toxin-antitoxin system HicB family antitoxin n=1 Tax=Thermococcus sp. MAR1 TaxID=1638263 RepID=UPI0014392C59|nr:type II toxin-antitoxin system HicB family antitoxin [Thermococcus sp. MAR1]NJE11274.1 type II toxin-antitoxin system HicB family antitoxin [Thermococcus sp. MAR1]
MIVKFDVYFDGKYWCARGINEDIFTQGKTLDELMENLQEAVELHFEEDIERGEKIIVMTLSEFEVSRVEQTASS